MGKNLLFNIANSDKIPRTYPMHLHHPDATRRTVSYYVPAIFREYTRQFPNRVKKFLQTCTPDRYNDDAFDGEIQAILQVAEQELQRQRHLHQDTILCIRQMNTANLAEINEQIFQIDQQIRDIDALLAKL